MNVTVQAPPGTSLGWHDEDEWLGIRSRVYFFDPAQVDGRTDAVSRCVPALAAAGVVNLRVVSPDATGQRKRWHAGGLSAQPDLVLEHGHGLLSVLMRNQEGPMLDPSRWRQHIRPDVMLHAVACAMVVAGETQRPTVALLRGVDALFQFDPSPPVLECLAWHVAPARRHWGEPRSVTAAQLAHFCETKVRQLPGLQQIEPPPPRWAGKLARG